MKHTPEDMVKGLRRNKGHPPTKASEAEYKRKMQEKKNNEQGYEVVEGDD